MKKLMIAFGALALLSSCGGDQAESMKDAVKEKVDEIVSTTTYAVDVASSSVEWSATMVGVKTHSGTMKLTEGSLTVENGAVTSGNFVIDMASITPTDTNYTAEQTTEMLVGHLSSPDFFNVAEFPTASFTVTGMNGDALAGDMTVRGKTNPENVKEVKIMEENGVLKATGKMVFNRQNYDVAWTHPIKEMVVSDDVTLNLTVVGN